MADAEIIPIGTRGRPGRGTGSAKPSASARNLAGSARPRPAARKAAPKQAAPQAAPADADPAPVETEQVLPRQSGDPGSAGGASNGTGTTSAGDARPKAAKSRRTSGRAPARETGAAPAGGAPDHADPPEAAAPGTAASDTDGHGWSSFTGSHHGAAGGGIPAIDWMQAFTVAAEEIFGDDWEDRLGDFLAFLRRRATGDYTVDEYGFDREVTERFFYSAIRPIAEKWFRVEVRGADNIPTDGGALVVSNHSGTVPMDGLVTGVSIFDHTGRHLRPLGADLVFRLPVIGELARKGGATLACNEDAERMLGDGELVGVWPEGFKGIGKPYADRYKLQRFGRGGFVSAAVKTGVPIVPCSVVGAEEIYPLVGNLPSLARLLGVPYIPITPFFPALGLLGLLPLPSKWLIEFGEPIRTDSYEAGAADDPMLVFNVTDQVRETIQQTLYSLLMQRRSVFH